MLISIIIRTKNEEKWLKASLAAIYAQSHKEIEIIIVDNGSTDKTVEVAKKMGIDKVLYIEKYNPSRALNMGVAASKGEICVFTSAHCIPVNTDWLSELIKPIFSSSLSCTYGRQLPTSQTNADNARDLLITFGKEPLTQKLDFKFHNANSAIKKDLISTYPFDEKLTNIEDWHWASDAIERGLEIGYVPSAAVFHHHGLHQHDDELVSFRAKPVSELLLNAYKIENHNEPFFDYRNWDGLIVCPNINDANLFEFMKMGLTEYFVTNNKMLNADTASNLCYADVDPSWDFYEFLLSLSISSQYLELNMRQFFPQFCQIGVKSLSRK